MDGENNGNLTIIKMDDLGVPPFRETPIWRYEIMQPKKEWWNDFFCDKKIFGSDHFCIETDSMVIPVPYLLSHEF